VRNNYLYLFGGMAILLVVTPALAEYLPHATMSILASIGYSAVLIFGLFTFTHHRIALYVGIGLSVALIAMSGMSHAFDNIAFQFVVQILFLIYLGMATWLAGEDVLFSGHYDINRMVGAVCIYQLLGMIFAVLYRTIFLFSPSDFADIAQGGDPTFYDFVYFSFVTLTTLGYGDLAPDGPLFRALAYSEAVVGQLYIATVIASLVGARLAEQSRKG
jgi:hypothetical protein